MVAGGGSDDVAVLLAIPGGGFAPAVRYGAGDGPTAVVVSDLDRDAVLDLAVTGQYSDDVTILLLRRRPGAPEAHPPS